MLGNWSSTCATPWPLGIILAAPQAGKLSDRYPPIALSSAGLAMFTLGLALLAMLPAHAATWDICWRGFVCGIGFGFFQSPNNREMLSNTVREFSANASGVLAVNNSDAYQAACLAGLGIIQAPLSGIAAPLADGRLVSLLPDYCAAPMPVTLLYPSRRHLSKRARGFMDWLAAVMAPHLS